MGATTRRAWVVLLPACLAGKERERPPVVTDALLLNDFAARYNAYVEALRQGTIDLRLWHRVCDRAEDLFGRCTTR